MRKTYTNLRSIVADVAFRKSRAAKVRFQGHREGEVPREVYLTSCAHLATPYMAEGYRYAASKQQLTLRQDPFLFYVAFSSSHNNVAGEYVALWSYAGVRSPELKRWRGAQPHPVGNADAVAGGQLGNLRREKAWLEWNLADPAAREAVLQDAAIAIAEFALPYFARFQHVSSLLDALITSDIPELSVGNAIELCLWLNEPARATTVGRRFLESRPDLAVAYSHALAQLRTNGFPRARRGSYAEELAWSSFAYGLHFV